MPGIPLLYRHNALACFREQLRNFSVLNKQYLKGTKNLSVAGQTPPPLAFVFDIDGVLLHGPNVLPAAKRMLNILNGKNVFQRKIPYILLTNGGGVAEYDRCRKLSGQLGVPVHSDKYKDKNVLVLGGKLDVVKKVAKGYGYHKSYTTLDVLAWNPSVWPFHTLSDAEQAVTQPVNFSETPISAIFVYHDPRNWALDIQIACDVIQSGGIIGGPYLPVNEQGSPVELIFCNPDLIWRADFERPRLGQGSFKIAFQAVFKALTGAEYPHTQYGKPTPETYHYAGQLLQNWIRKSYGPGNYAPHLYMVGDNPESDIAGGNAAKWSSILVNTGVYDPAQGLPMHQPTHYAEDVEEAVKWAIQQHLRSEHKVEYA